MRANLHPSVRHRRDGRSARDENIVIMTEDPIIPGTSAGMSTFVSLSEVLSCPSLAFRAHRQARQVEDAVFSAKRR